MYLSIPSLLDLYCCGQPPPLCSLYFIENLYSCFVTCSGKQLPKPGSPPPCCLWNVLYLIIYFGNNTSNVFLFAFQYGFSVFTVLLGWFFDSWYLMNFWSHWNMKLRYKPLISIPELKGSEAECWMIMWSALLWWKGIFLTTGVT